MSNKAEPIDEFHKLVEEERYREARGVLETEDIEPEIVEKWLAWLDDLQREERLQMGVESDKAKENPARSLAQIGQMIGGTAAAMLMVLPAWALVMFTFASFHSVVAGLFLLTGLIFGFLGWRRVLNLFIPEHAMLGAALLSAGLFVFVVSSGLPLWFYYDPPVHYLLAAFALVFPYMAYMSWLAGGWMGTKVTGLLTPPEEN